MFNLSKDNIHLSAQAENKTQAIELVAQALEQAGYVEKGYLQGMLAREEQTSTYLGNGIAIPHGTLDTRQMVKKTGVQIFQFPQGVEWSEGNIAHVVIGIAAHSDEHLALLRQLMQVLGDEERTNKLAQLQDIEQFKAILTGEEAFIVPAENISLDVETTSLLTLTAINAGKLQQQSAVNNLFVSEVIANPALPLGNGLWITDATVGNEKNALAFSRAKTAFQHNNKQVNGVLTIAAVNEQVEPILVKLLDPQVQQQLLQGNVSQILTALQDKPAVATHQTTENTTQPRVIGTFTIRNEHGLHARPSAVLVNEVKKYQANIQVQNIDRNTDLVSAKSAMRIMSLGVVQGHRLRFIAEGEDAQQAIENIGKAIVSGLEEHTFGFLPKEEDKIEIEQVKNEAESVANDELEAIFRIRNEHGLHARPSAMLVNEVKKYNATIQVQNLDRDSQLVSAKSLMKIVALGVQKGHRLRFVATGEEAQQALDGIGKAIEAGLGE